MAHTCPPLRDDGQNPLWAEVQALTARVQELAAENARLCAESARLREEITRCWLLVEAAAPSTGG